MKYWAIGLLAVASAAGVSAQTFSPLFDKAPAGVDEALRARVQRFYQAHIDGKPRLADQMVHEDSKDVFFQADKPKYKTCKVSGIKFEENYTKARVTMDCEVEHFFIGGGLMTAPMAVPSLWKMDQGEWWWYVIPYDVKAGVNTPFGVMQETTGTGQPLALVQKIDSQGVSLRDIQSAVQPDRSEVDLKSSVASSAEVAFSSKFPGDVNLRMDPVDTPGVVAKLEKATLKPGETVKLTIEYKPSERVRPKLTEATVMVRVEPTNQAIPIKISFTE